MRALAYTKGGSTRCVDLPEWVRVRARGDQVWCECSRCGIDERLDKALRADAERALGRFVLWHRGCLDRATLVARTKPARNRTISITYLTRREPNTFANRTATALAEKER